VPTEPVTDVFALLEIPQFIGPGHLPLWVRLGQEGADSIHPGATFRADLRVEKLRSQRFHGDPAAGCSEPLNAVEQQLLGRRRQIRHQALGRPGARCRGVKTSLLQRRRPVMAQIDRNGNPVAGRLCPVLAQRRRFEIQHLGLVEFVDRRPVRQGNRQDRESRPAARITTWRMPARVALRKKVSKKAVREAI
jgi:hypothetical protein